MYDFKGAAAAVDAARQQREAARSEPNPVASEPTEYDRETARLREKIATTDYFNPLPGTMVGNFVESTLMSADTNRLLAREQGGPNRRVARDQGDTLAGQALETSRGQTLRGLGGVLRGMGADTLGDFIGGAGVANIEAGRIDPEASAGDRYVFDTLTAAFGVGTDILVGVATRSPKGFAASAALRAAGNQYEDSLIEQQ